MTEKIEPEVKQGIVDGHQVIMITGLPPTAKLVAGGLLLVNPDGEPGKKRIAFGFGNTGILADTEIPGAFNTWENLFLKLVLEPQAAAVLLSGLKNTLADLQQSPSDN